jgi:hypothetical protein
MGDNFMPLHRLLTLNLFAICLVASLQGCGSDSSNKNAAPATVAANSVDLKNLDDAALVASALVAQLAVPRFGLDNSALFGPSRPSSSNTVNCAPSGNQQTVVTNADATASVGDNISTRLNQCAFFTDFGSRVETGDFSSAITAISGDFNNLALLSQATLRKLEQTSLNTDETYQGLRYVGRITQSFNTTVNLEQDGKASAVTSDDIASAAEDSSGTSTGTVNGLPISLSLQSSSRCTKTTAGAICAKADSSMSGNLIRLGALNVSASATTALQFNANNVPVAGTLSVTQGATTSTAQFSVVNSAPTVTITVAGGAAKSLSYADFILLSQLIY